VSSNDVRRRLRRRADELGLDFQQAIQYYAIERFLFRLSESEYADVLVVKGATLLRVWGGAVARPARDIDFLGHLDNSPEAVEAIVKSCLTVDVPDDGLSFDEMVTAEQIALDSKYPGIRAKLRGTLEGARFVLQLDIGIDDAAVPAPGWVDYPTLLEGPSPRILAYHPATAVAEKFEAIVRLGLANSRMKDFYDLWMLATIQSFRGPELRGSIAATFERRQTPLPTEVPVGLTPEFAERENTARMWDAFIRRLAVSGIAAPAGLLGAIGMIVSFVMPAATAASHGDQFDMVWSSEHGWQP
jgi:hypothetical protein